MTKDNLDVTEAVARLETACARAEYEFPLLAAPDGTVAVPFADLRALLSMQSAREPKPASPPTGDVVEAITAWLYAREGGVSFDQLYPMEQEGWRRQAREVAALATLQPADPIEPKGGFAYFNEDTGMEWSRNHPVESGEVPDATEIEAMTLGEFRHRWPADPVEPKVSSDVEAVARAICESAGYHWSADPTRADLMNANWLRDATAAIATLRASEPKASSDVVGITCPQHFDPYCHACQAALLPTLRASDPSRELVEWQPIDSAPKDGSFILLAGSNFDGGQAVVQWDDGFDNWTLDDGKNPEIAVRNERKLTHWRPLPVLPALAQGQSR